MPRLFTVISLCLASTSFAADTGEPIKAHIIAACGEYSAEASLRAFREHLEKNFKITCTASYGKDGCEHLENIGELPKAELLILFARRMKLVPEEMKLIREHCEAGKPVVAIRTACHAFDKDDNDWFDHEVLGGNYQGHYGDGPCNVTNIEGRGELAVLDGVAPFKSAKLYKMGPLAKDTAVVQEANNGTNREPVTMLHEYKGGRVFFTSLGVPEDFGKENFRRLLENAIFWATKRERAKLQQNSESK